MQFIEALKLRSKLFMVFVFITLSLVSIGIMGTTYVNAMKKNIDALYFGSLVPVTELNDIIRTYHTQLAATLYKTSRDEISLDETVISLENGLKVIAKRWKSYFSHYKTADEMEYLEYADVELQETNNYFYEILRLAKEGKDLTKLSIHTLENKVSNIDSVMQKLLKYEIDVAKYERKKFLHTYNDIMMQIGFILVFVIILIIGILLYVFRSIQHDHNRLEKVAKKLKIVNKKLENASYTDSLTHLHNRRYFNFIYERELKRAKRSKSYITFMMLDIDYFKQYNDTYGHIEGDKALRKVAQVLQNTLKRPSDYIFRLGGEEFGVLLSETDASNSAQLAREICDSLREEKIEHKNSLVCEYMTLSIGVVCCVADDALEDEVLISRADEMLYRAKESGRDRYIITTDISRAKVLKLQEDEEEEILIA